MAALSIERAVHFECCGDRLVGILHEAARPEGNVGILIVVGGPQYRVGSHRQFVMMARDWASAGYPVFRFDYRGMGDSGGEPRSFDTVDADIRAAIDVFMREAPTLVGVAVFGLCDAASAALMYCVTDTRVLGKLIANPWVRTPEGEARTFVRHYYGARLLQASFWKKLFAGELRAGPSLRGFFGSLFRAHGLNGSSDAANGENFIERMLTGLRTFSGPVLILISEHDLTAQEFTDLCADDASWSAAVRRPRVTVQKIDGADHTFASHVALAEALRVSQAWLAELKLPQA